MAQIKGLFCGQICWIRHEATEDHFGHRIRRALQRTPRVVTRARQPLLITRRGKAVAQISPFRSSKTRGKKAVRAKPLNPLEGSIVYEGDLISPIDVRWKEMP